MNGAWGLAVDGGIIAVLFLGISRFRTPAAARQGNGLAALALLLAAAAVLLRNPLDAWSLVVGTAVAGSLLGLLAAARVTMIQIPGMVAFQHGAGGVAACLISLVEVLDGAGGPPTAARIAGLLGLFVGAATFSGSMIASGKLFGVLRSAPRRLPAHGTLTAALLLLATAAVGAGAAAAPLGVLPAALVLAGLSVALGWLVAVRIGGADMPVLISFLNATAGIAAAFCGVAVHNRLLVACGAAVAASGTILTLVMCRAMNRGLLSVFTGIAGSTPSTAVPVDPGAPQAPAEPNEPDAVRDPFGVAVQAARQAHRTIIVPGYGMALAQAQFELVGLARDLERRGAAVHFAIHPVAGRMPGHMNVLLAEADAPYDQLLELEESNQRFAEADLVLVVGACDVVNPAAVETPDTPISGMPILEVGRARRVVVCNLDRRPGYSGVDNLLYRRPNVALLTGDAKQTVARLRAALAGNDAEAAVAPAAPGPAGPSTTATEPFATAIAAARAARSVVVVPGYGMALAQAQFEVVGLARDLERRGAEVRFAIHPVAGRMPGHMNVLLAEADAPYDQLLELEEGNRRLPDTDLALVVGASDVVNPAAVETPDTPISGMPILEVGRARQVVVCNLDERPGYSGVDNLLYRRPNVALLTGDAKQTVARLRAALAGDDAAAGAETPRGPQQQEMHDGTTYIQRV